MIIDPIYSLSLYDVDVWSQFAKITLLALFFISSIPLSQITYVTDLKLSVSEVGYSHRRSMKMTLLNTVVSILLM